MNAGVQPGGPGSPGTPGDPEKGKEERSYCHSVNMHHKSLITVKSNTGFLMTTHV